jgi:hypothetical protein
MGVSEQKARELARAVNLDLRSCNIKKWQSAIDYEVSAKEKTASELSDSQWVSLAKIAHRRFISQSNYDPSSHASSHASSQSLPTLTGSASLQPTTTLSSSSKKTSEKGSLKPISSPSSKK